MSDKTIQRGDYVRIRKGEVSISGQVIAVNNINQYSRERNTWEVVRYIIWLSDENTGQIYRSDLRSDQGTVDILETKRDRFDKLMAQSKEYLPIAKNIPFILCTSSAFDNQEQRRGFLNLFAQLKELSTDNPNNYKVHKLLYDLYEHEVTVGPSAPGKYFPHQFVGLLVFTASGNYLGKISIVFATRTSYICEVRGESPNETDLYMFPLIRNVVLSIDVLSKKMIVRDEESQYTRAPSDYYN